MWGAPLNRLGRQMKKSGRKLASSCSLPSRVQVSLLLSLCTASLSSFTLSMQAHTSEPEISRKLLDFNFGLRPSLPTSPPLRGFWHFGVGNYLTEQLLRSKVPQYIKFELTSNHISQSTHKKNPIYFSLSFEPVPLGIWIMQVAFRGWLFLVNVSRF